MLHVQIICSSMWLTGQHLPVAVGSGCPAAGAAPAASAAAAAAAAGQHGRTAWRTAGRTGCCCPNWGRCQAAGRPRGPECSPLPGGWPAGLPAAAGDPASTGRSVAGPGPATQVNNSTGANLWVNFRRLVATMFAYRQRVSPGDSPVHFCSLCVQGYPLQGVAPDECKQVRMARREVSLAGK